MRIFEYSFCLNGNKCLTLYGVVTLFENKIKTKFDVSGYNFKHNVVTILDFSVTLDFYNCVIPVEFFFIITAPFRRHRLLRNLSLHLFSGKYKQRHWNSFWVERVSTFKAPSKLRICSQKTSWLPEHYIFSFLLLLIFVFWVPDSLHFSDPVVSGSNSGSATWFDPFLCNTYKDSVKSDY